MAVRTARKYERSGLLPSQMKQPRSYRTRPDPFEEDWPWVVDELERDPALQAKTLFEVLCQGNPGRYQETQLRTLQRRIEKWRALSGPERDVMFEQVHQPGRMAQTDFTDMRSLSVTIAGAPFEHLYFHMVLTYSNVEAAKLCFSESFEALAEGIEFGLWQFGGVPLFNRTDCLSAAVRRLDTEGRREFTERYEGLMAHYKMTPTHNTAGESHQNGDVEQSHHRFKEAIDQALRVRNSRDFATRADYESFVQAIVRCQVARPLAGPLGCATLRTGLLGRAVPWKTGDLDKWSY
ncbi:MAG: IS21 family transposase, partial [Cyanobacteria bacterium REEB65]|nr:IS21 family transposase [Cyanobacteria bacterium REEB65]